MSEETSFKFLDCFTNILDIKKENIHKLTGSSVNVQNVKNTLYNFIFENYTEQDINPKFYIYMNGHGNQVPDNNNEEIDLFDEIYQLPDGNLLDDDITNIIKNAVQEKSQKFKEIKPFVCLISDHCSSGSTIDNLKDNYKLFDWISIGSSLDNQDSLMTGDGNVMTINLINLLQKLHNEGILNNITSLQFNEMLQKEMKESFIGDLQTATFHVSNNEMLSYKLFE